VKAKKPAKLKAKGSLATMKQLCVSYAEVTRLRQAIIETHSAGTTRDVRLAPK
jgi:hypothetical protein